jgi:regulator of protease activity HflC (stomatin/prohibitin superfamily)
MEMSAGFVVVLALLVFAVVTIAKGVRIVPQGEEWIVERLGKYHGTLKPGLNIVIPYIDKVAYQLVTKDIILDVQEQEVITRDNAVILTNAIAFIKVTDPVKAVYGITDFSEAIRNLIMTTLRSIVGEMELDEALSSRDKIKARLRESIADEAGRLGFDGQISRDSGHQALAVDAKGHGNAGRCRTRAQSRGDPRRRCQASGDSGSRSPP